MLKKLDKRERPLRKELDDDEDENEEEEEEESDS
jgi:hypothetical protein